MSSALVNYALELDYEKNAARDRSLSATKENARVSSDIALKGGDKYPSVIFNLGVATAELEEDLAHETYQNRKALVQLNRQRSAVARAANERMKRIMQLDFLLSRPELWGLYQDELLPSLHYLYVNDSLSRGATPYSVRDFASYRRTKAVDYKAMELEARNTQLVLQNQDVNAERNCDSVFVDVLGKHGFIRDIVENMVDSLNSRLARGDVNSAFSKLKRFYEIDVPKEIMRRQRTAVLLCSKVASTILWNECLEELISQSCQDCLRFNSDLEKISFGLVAAGHLLAANAVANSSDFQASTSPSLFVKDAAVSEFHPRNFFARDLLTASIPALLRDSKDIATSLSLQMHESTNSSASTVTLPQRKDTLPTLVGKHSWASLGFQKAGRRPRVKSMWSKALDFFS